MQYKLEDISQTKKKIKFDIPVDEVSKAFQRAYQKVRGQANIKGFRKGKVPDQLLEQYYSDQIRMECVQNVVDVSLDQMLTEKSLNPVTQPNFNLKPIEKNQAYSYEVELEVFPPVELKPYKEIKVKKKDESATAEEIEAETLKIRENWAQLAPLGEGAAIEKGNIVNLDFNGTVDGQAAEGLNSKGYVLEIGSGRFLKEFEDQMIGLKAGDEKKISLKYPDDYFEARFKGKNGEFDVKINTVYKKDLPKFDEELAKDMGLENLEALKKNIEETVSNRKKIENRSDYVRQITDQLKSSYNFDVPQGLIEAESKQKRGGDQSAEEITDMLRVQFVLEEIARQEKISVEPQDFDRRLRMFSQYTGRSLEELIKYYEEHKLFPQLHRQLLIEKTLDFLVDNVKLEG